MRFVADPPLIFTLFFFLPSISLDSLDSLDSSPSGSGVKPGLFFLFLSFASAASLFFLFFLLPSRSFYQLLDLLPLALSLHAARCLF